MTGAKIATDVMAILTRVEPDPKRELSDEQQERIGKELILYAASSGAPWRGLRCELARTKRAGGAE